MLAVKTVFLGYWLKHKLNSPNYSNKIPSKNFLIVELEVV
jgi:hypothetical protein